MAYLLKANGLQTFRNELDAIEGSLQVADNVVIDEDGVIEPRRGFADYTQSATSSPIKQLLQYKTRLLRHYSDKLQWDNGSGTFTDFTGSYTEVESGIRMKYQEANGNLFFNTVDGVKKIAVTDPSQFATTTITTAGGVKAIGFTAALTLTGSVQFLLVGKSVGYKVLWGIKDINENLIYGSPSTKVVISNTLLANQDVLLTVQIPEEVTSDVYFYQIYRTAFSSTADAVSDEFQLVYESNVTATDITNKYFTYLDETPDSFRESGDYLYTNAITGEGILQANEKPPIAKDITLFKNSMFYANTKSRHKLAIDLISALALDTYSLKITSASVTRTYVFSNAGPEANTPTGGTIKVSTTGSVAIDIDETARSIERVINKDPTSNIYCYYLTSEGSLPGQMLFENRDLADVPFYVSVDNIAIAKKFNPEAPIFPATTLASDNEIAPNRLYFSKYSQPEAVPTLNYIDIGPKDKAIIRILGLRDLLYVFKEDGVYTVSGDLAPNFSATLLDGTSKLIAPDSISAFANKIYMLSSDGIGFAIGSGTAVISRDIENLVLKATANNMNSYYTAFGMSSDSDKSYFLFLPSKSTDTSATQCFRYNIFTETWTRWTISATCGLINDVNDKIYLGESDRSVVIEERKNRDRTDFADRDFQVNFVEDSINEATLLLDSILNVEVGDVFLQTQYVTEYEFNSMLRKLDLDLGLAQSKINGASGFVAALNINPGNNLQLKLTALDAMLASDANIGTWTTVVFPTDFAGIQTKFNELVAQLNSGLTGTALKNYLESDGTLVYEALILGIESSTNTVTLSSYLPYIHGSVDGCRVFKAIKSDVQWKPQHFGAPDKTKQIRETTVILDQNNFYSAEILFASDLSTYFDTIEVAGRGNGAFGSNNWGEDNFGGNGADIPFRTLVPLEKQRCRYLTCRFRHLNAREQFRLLGISAEVRAVSSRGYR